MDQNFAETGSLIGATSPKVNEGESSDHPTVTVDEERDSTFARDLGVMLGKIISFNGSTISWSNYCGKETNTMVRKSSAPRTIRCLADTSCTCLWL